MLSPEIFAGLVRDDQKMFTYTRGSESVRHIIKSVGQLLEIDIDDIIGLDRHKNIVEARHISIYIIRKLNPGVTLKEIGATFRRDHSTIIHSINVTEDLAFFDKDFRKKLTDCEQNI